MMHYAQATRCRTAMLLEYFGEEPKESCDHCDNCTPPPDAKLLAGK